MIPAHKKEDKKKESTDSHEGQAQMWTKYVATNSFMTWTTLCLHSEAKKVLPA